MITNDPWSSLISGAEKLQLPMDEAALSNFQRYTDLLLEANKRTNLTAVRDVSTMITKLYLDSISLLPFIASNMGISNEKLLALPWKAIDIGTGAGIPGLPLYFLWHALQVDLVESQHKKILFLTQVIFELGLGPINVLGTRAETLGTDAAFREQYDLVLARAVASMPALVELTLPFAKIDGLIVLPKGPKVIEEVHQAETAITLLGGQIQAVEELEVPGVEETRVAVLIRKIAPTPMRYPRKPGMPTKRPLMNK